MKLCSGADLQREIDESTQGPNVLAYPVEDSDEVEFLPLHRANNECVPIRSFDLDVKSVPPQKDVGGSERDALITVDEAMVVAQRLHQSGCFFLEGIVIADLRTKNGGLNRALIADTVETAEYLDQSILHPVDFRHREVIRHLEFYFARRCSKSRLRATDCSKSSITSGRTRCCDGTTLCR